MTHHSQQPSEPEPKYRVRTKVIGKLANYSKAMPKAEAEQLAQDLGATNRYSSVTVVADDEHLRASEVITATQNYREDANRLTEEEVDDSLDVAAKPVEMYHVLYTIDGEADEKISYPAKPYDEARKQADGLDERTGHHVVAVITQAHALVRLAEKRDADSDVIPTRSHIGEKSWIGEDAPPAEAFAEPSEGEGEYNTYTERLLRNDALDYALKVAKTNGGMAADEILADAHKFLTFLKGKAAIGE